LDGPAVSCRAVPALAAGGRRTSQGKMATTPTRLADDQLDAPPRPLFPATTLFSQSRDSPLQSAARPPGPPGLDVIRSLDDRTPLSGSPAEIKGTGLPGGYVHMPWLGVERPFGPSRFFAFWPPPAAHPPVCAQGCVGCGRGPPWSRSWSRSAPTAQARRPGMAGRIVYAGRPISVRLHRGG
jgi:hypothetical protein